MFQLEIVFSCVQILKGLTFEIGTRELLLWICFVLTAKSYESYHQTGI